MRRPWPRLKAMSNSPHKPATVEREDGATTYRVRADGEWATIVLFGWERPDGARTRHAGEILIHSSFGSWANSWSNCGSSIQEFIAQVDFQYLFLKFMGDKLYVYDGEGTYLNVLRKIRHARREAVFTKDMARFIYGHVVDAKHEIFSSLNEMVEVMREGHRLACEEMFGADAFDNICNVRALDNWFEEPWEMRARKYDEQPAGFWRELWPAYKAQLQQELKEKNDVAHAG